MKRSKKNARLKTTQNALAAGKRDTLFALVPEGERVVKILMHTVMQIIVLKCLMQKHKGPVRPPGGRGP